MEAGGRCASGSLPDLAGYHLSSHTDEARCSPPAGSLHWKRHRHIFLDLGRDAPVDPQAVEVARSLSVRTCRKNRDLGRVLAAVSSLGRS